MRIFLLLAAATTLAASPPPAAAQASAKEPARPLRDLNAYVDDYPASAIRAGEQGTVRFTLDISADGRVTRCSIVESSGSPLLDATTCRTLRARARFTPARDAAGNAVPDTIASSIRWSLPDDPATGGAAPVPGPGGGERPHGATRATANLVSYLSADDYPAEAILAEEQGTVRFRLTVGPDGRVSDCAIAESSGSASLDSTTCRILTERARFTPATDAGGNPTTDTVVSTIRWVLPQGGETSPEASAAFHAWLQCLKVQVLPHFPNRARTTRQIAEAAFPAFRTEEEKIAAFHRADPSGDHPTAAENSMRTLRAAIVDFIDQQRKILHP